MESSNAYKLADRLENEINLSENLFVFDAANMLRQQADRIAELKKDVSGFVGRGERVANQIQTKPLSDEEILQFQDKVPYTLGSDLIEFARAIEERHGIK